ncbi:MAG: TonB-dependent receptor plug domain-containing protein, partial [Hyphomonadaceae bacterium]
MLLKTTSIAALATAFIGSPMAQSQTADVPIDTVVVMDEITVTGAAGGAENVAGSVTLLSPEDLEVQGQSDVLRILRAVPGVNIQEEEGFGLRPNIGLRGSGSDRSARIALMEDGVPVAPAAYAAPSAYYFPSAGRIHAIEVTKGPAVIRYGPRTTGGAINLISTPIPDMSEGMAEVFLGGDDRQRFHAWAGTRQEITDGLVFG